MVQEEWQGFCFCWKLAISYVREERLRGDIRKEFQRCFMNMFSCMFNLATLKYNDLHILHFILGIMQPPLSSLAARRMCHIAGQTRHCPLGSHSELWRMGCRKLFMHSCHRMLFYWVEKRVNFFCKNNPRAAIDDDILLGFFWLRAKCLLLQNADQYL